MPKNQNCEIWQHTIETYYCVYYEEVAAEILINYWQLLDEFSKIIIAITASGSAISGWTLWNKPEYRISWLVIAGLGSLLAIIHSTLSVSNRIENWNDTKKYFSSLRLDIEKFLSKITITNESTYKEYSNIRDRYKEGMQKKKNDILWTNFLEKKAQKNLDLKIENNQYNFLLKTSSENEDGNS